MSGRGRGNRHRRRWENRRDTERAGEFHPQEAVKAWQSTRDQQQQRQQSQGGAQGQQRQAAQRQGSAQQGGRQAPQRQGSQQAGQGQRQTATAEQRILSAVGTGLGPRQGGAQRRQTERLKWIPPVPPREALPVFECPWCGKPIRELSLAIANKKDNLALHFDCVREKVEEILEVMRALPEKDDELSYIGGGRFGVVHFNKRPEPQKDERSSRQKRRDEHRARQQAATQPREKPFIIKRIIDWEDPEDRAPWRKLLSDRFSLT